MLQEEGPIAYFRCDTVADVVFIEIREPEGGERDGESIDELRIRHYDHAGNVCAYEFLFVKGGISLDGIEADAAARICEAIEPVRRLAVS